MESAVASFESAQARLFEQTGTQATSHFLTMNVPAARVSRVHVVEAGHRAAPPLVLIHGGNSVAAGLEPLLSLLQNDFHLYAPDRPGCGLTDKVDYHGVPFREHAVEFVGGVLDGLGLTRVSLAGNSMGGYWSLLYALAHPERVASVALLGEPAGSPPRPVLRYRLICTPGINRLLYATVLKPNRTKARKQLAPIVAHPERVSEAFLDMSHAAAMLPGAQRAWLSMLENVWPVGQPPRLTYALRAELAHIQCPSLFVWGGRDLCPPAWGKELCTLMPRSRIEVIPDASHLIWLDEPERVASLLREFLLQ